MKRTGGRFSKPATASDTSAEIALWAGWQVEPCVGSKVTIIVGEALRPGPDDDHVQVTAELRARISELADRAQRGYPDKPAGPQDTWWLPAHLGGTAPAPEAAPAGD